MNKQFLKENIIQSRQNDNTGKNALKLIKIDKQNNFLFEKNIFQFVEMIDFLSKRDDVFVLTGFSLCGKSLMTSVIPQIISENTVLHSFKCNPASTLDDLLLTFFNTFKIYAQKNLVHLPKIDTQNFQEKINIYLTKCENPILIILDGFNEIQNSKNKEEIMNFLSQIVNMENIKLIITTRNFDVSDLKNINLRLYTSIIKPLKLDDLEEYCLINVINSEGLEDFYKISRGHYFNFNLMLSYIQPTNLTIKEFVKEVEDSSKGIGEILIAKNLSLIPQSYNQLLWVAASSDFGMPKSNLLTMPDIDEEQILFLQKKGIIEIVNDSIYVKDYFKTEILKSIEPLAHNSIIKGIVKFLESQLPLKPALRELQLSRLTIRNEIQRLNDALNKAVPKNLDKTKASYMSILGYSKQFKTNWDGFDDIIMPKNFQEKEKEEEEPIAEVEEKEPVFNAEKNSEDDKDFNAEITALGFARMLKNKYSYSDALVQYADALSDAMNSHDTLITISILKDIAECYFKLGDYQNAIENYGKAHELAKKEKNIDECYEIILKIADVYKGIYRKDLSDEIYKDIMSQEEINDVIKLKAELNLFESNFYGMNPNEIVQKYYQLLEKAKDNKEIVSKIHFRLGFLYDKASSFDSAIKHYKASFEVCDDYSINENLSSCYYNLAEIYNDRKDYDNALDYYLKSLTIDEITKNTEGVMITTKKVAVIYEKKGDKLALKYYEKMLDLAKATNDNYHLACAFLDLGDYYYRKKDDMEALKVYLSAKRIMNNQLTHENEMAIKDRINDLKVRMGENVVENIVREFS